MAKKSLKPLNSTDQELDMAAIVTPEDVERARVWADKYGTPLIQDILETPKRAEEDSGSV